jgi:phosphatidate cytidylyltransferase
MNSIFYYVPVYLALAALGMSIANKKAEAVVRKQRWLKYFSYIIITGIVITSVFLHFFKWISVVIVLGGALELLLIGLKNRRRLFFSFVIYGLIACGFIFFSFNFSMEAVLFIYFQVFIFDAFGQITGQLFGKRSLIPKISPAKTVEGLIGGWLFCIISALLASEWVHIPLGQALLFGLFTGFTSFCGDVLASWFKRRQHIKDYSNWLPGQGGFLDRFDSFIFTGCAYYLAGLLFENLI